MKVLIVAGVARSLVNFRGPLIRELRSRGYEVVAAAPFATPQLLEALAALGARFCELPLSRAGTNPLHDLRTINYLRELFRAERPDVVLTYTIKPIIYSGIAAAGLRCARLFAMVTGLGYTFGKTEGAKQRIVGQVTRRLYGLALRRYEGIVFQNPDDQADFRAAKLLPRGVRVTRVNGSGVDLDQFAPVELPTRASFLMVGRLLKEKGVLEYLSAARLIKKRHPGTTFRLVGSLDPNPSSLSKHDVEDLQKEGLVEYLGRLEDVRPAIAASSIYVLPSYREGTPRTVLEAMAMGRAVITTDVPGCRETVEHGVNGLLVPARDVPALASAMEQLILSPELVAMMGEAGLNRARQKFEAGSVARSVVDFLESSGAGEGTVS